MTVLLLDLCRRVCIQHKVPAQKDGYSSAYCLAPYWLGASVHGSEAFILV